MQRDAVPRTRRQGAAESPRFFDDGLEEDTATLQELEEVKKERQILMRSIAQCKTSEIVAGGEAQDNDIQQLMKARALPETEVVANIQPARFFVGAQTKKG